MISLKKYLSISLESWLPPMALSHSPFKQYKFYILIQNEDGYIFFNNYLFPNGGVKCGKISDSSLPSRIMSEVLHKCPTVNAKRHRTRLNEHR